MKRNIKKVALAAMLAGMLGSLTGCFIQPDPTLDPLQINDGTVPFGTVQALPTNTPTPVPQSTPSPHAGYVAIQRSEHVGGLVERQSADNHAQNGGDCRAGRQSWQTSTQDYNAGYPVLRVGSTGSDVSDLQARLTELGYYTGTIDGKYSTGTQSAVTEFQSRNGLQADGIAGPRDAGQALFRIGAAQDSQRQHDGKRLYAAQGGRIRFGGAQIAGPSGGAGVLRRRRGWHLRLDDDQRREGAFQRANGLSGDGQAGTQTQTKLYSANAKYANQSGDDGEPGSDAQLSVGMTGNDVYALQERLIELNYLSGVADGVYSARRRRTR